MSVQRGQTFVATNAAKQYLGVPSEPSLFGNVGGFCVIPHLGHGHIHVPPSSAGVVPVRQARAAESKSNQLQDLLDSWKN